VAPLTGYIISLTRFETHRFGVALFAKGITISGKVRLESLHFKVSQRHNITY